MKPIAVTHLSTYDNRGGAGIAATRLHLALLATGVKSSQLVRYKTGKDPHTYLGDVAEMESADDAIIARAIQSEYLDKRRTKLSNTLLSLAYPGIDVVQHPILAKSDVLNLHWVSSFLSVESIGALFSMGIPVVWTLHDQHAFTGGCHYSAGCLGFTQECRVCPQLMNDSYELMSARLKDRIQLFSGSQRPLIVTPSEWMRQCALSSQVFRDAEIITIHNSVPIDRFFPGSRFDARRELGIPTDMQCILFGAESHNEKRKGFADLISALRLCLSDASSAILLKKTTVLCFGEPDDELLDFELNIVSLGNIEHESRLRLAYVAADVFVLPSHEDNLPNTVLESLACGTPVLAYNVGGIPEAVRHQETGWLLTCGDTKALGQTLMEMLKNPDSLQTYSKAARTDAVKKFAPLIQAQSYREVYQELLCRNKVRSDKSLGKKFKKEPLCATIERAHDFDLIYADVARDSVLPAYIDLVKEHNIVTIDRMVRGQQIETLNCLIKECESDRSARGQQIESLTKILQDTDRDRVGLDQQISSLIMLLKESEADRRERGEQIETLTSMLLESESDRANRGEQIESLTSLYKESEEDRRARGEQIETLTSMLLESESDRANRGEQIESLTSLYKESEEDRSARGEQIETLTSMLIESESDRVARGEQIDILSRMVNESELIQVELKRHMQILSTRLNSVESDLSESLAQLDDVKKGLCALITRPGFRLLRRVNNWPEIQKLVEKLGMANE